MPIGISYGAELGPGFDVTVIEVNSGFEKRNINRGGVGLVEGELRYNVLTPAEHETLLAFIRALKGQGHGFRARDWTDYIVTTANGVLIAVAGSPGVYQLVKRYSAGALTDDRNIRKPVAGTVTIYRDGVADTAGSGAGQYSLDTTTGRVTYVPNSSKTITGITQANPGVLTVTAHGFPAGALVGVSGVSGMTQINGQSGTVTVVDADHISLGINTTSYSAYTSGGTASRYGDAADVLTWGGEFDIACRFKGRPRAVVESRSGPNLAIRWEDAGVVEILT